MQQTQRQWHRPSFRRQTDVAEETGSNSDPHLSDLSRMALEDYTNRCRQPQSTAPSRSSLVSDCYGACACNVSGCALRGFCVLVTSKPMYYNCHVRFFARGSKRKDSGTLRTICRVIALSLTTMYTHSNNIVIIAFFVLLNAPRKQIQM